MKIHIKCVQCQTINEVDNSELDTYIRRIAMRYIMPSVN